MHRLRNILPAALILAIATLALAGGPPSTMPAASAPSAYAPKPQFWFGVAVENIPPAIAKQLKLNPDQGLMIYTVLPDSPAQKAGLQAEDILLEINGGPLTTQDDLFHAANPPAVGKTPAAPKSSELTYLRGGDRTTIQITPAARPSNMIVFGDTDKPNKVVNYVAPNGGAAQVGPGLRVDLSSNPGNFTVQSIKAIVSKGQTIILSQETDTQGNVKNTITVGNTSHTVDPLHLDALPEELRPFAEQLIAGTPSQAQAPTPKPAATTSSLEQRLKDLENQNAELQKRVKELEKTKSN